MTKSEDASISADATRRATVAEACKKELKALHTHHPEQWRRNLIQIQTERHNRAHGIGINATGRSFAGKLEGRNVVVRSSGNGTLVK